ncbi:MAG: hypothetical protein MJD61_06845, partial [Proteobacteria bacterium]|nr:hypothetical protein [Pseudomonadota bacterium]
DVELVGLPASAEGVDDLFEVEAFLDLGAEGLIVREVGESSLDRLQRRQSTSVFRFFTQPALQGPLADALYYVRGGHFSEQSGRVPFTVSIKRALRPTAGGRVRLDDFLGIPRSRAPSRGEPIPGDRVLRWSGTGGKSDAHYVSIRGGDGHPAWRLIVAGTQQQAPIPDLSSLPDLSDIPGGSVSWTVQALRIPGFAFNQLRYSLLSTRYLTHRAVNSFIMRR